MLLLSVLILFAQGIPALPGDTATVSGVLRTASGAPAVGVRVAAALQPDPTDPAPAGALVSITETDQEGRYRLENIPAGRYYITAGRVDLPTYYPGTLDFSTGTVVAIARGAQISRMDFTLKEESAGRQIRQDQYSFFSVFGTTGGFHIPLQISVEDGGKVPIVVGFQYPVLRVTQSGRIAQEVLLNATSLVLPLPSVTSPGEYRVELADIPPDYAAKSILLGSGANAIDLSKEPLRLSLQGLPTFRGTILGTTGAIAQSDKTLSIVLSRTATRANSNGSRVTGSSIPSEEPIYLSGVPGTTYSDGSFEFNGVASGRHTLVRYRGSSLPSLGIQIVVGSGDVDGVKLQTTTMLPQNIEADAPRLAGTHTPGTTLPLSSIRGIVLQDVSGEAVAESGAVTVTGYRNQRRAYAIDHEGRFEIPDLLPGSYLLELAVSGYRADIRTIIVDDGNAEIVFRGRKDAGVQ
jgi:hypothetical protein